MKYLIVGLGNPGRNFLGSYHNLGFAVLDEFQKENNFSKFSFKKHLFSQISFKKRDNKTIILAKPTTFMNDSGKAVKKLLSFYSISPEKLLVIHDEIDFPEGKIKLSFKKGSAGHKGVESIISTLGRKNFFRLRIGICPKRKPKNLKKFVLKKIPKSKEKIFKKTIKIASKKIKEFLKKMTN